MKDIREPKTTSRLSTYRKNKTWTATEETNLTRRRRRPGRPLKRLLDGYNREAETGHLLA